MRKITVSAFLITALIIFLIIGISLAFENGRVEEVRENIANIDVLWNDARFFSQYMANPSESKCGALEEENLKLGERIYNEGLRIERYEGANKLTDALLTEKKRYALLDLQFLKNSLEIKSACNSSFSTVVYLYSQYNKTNEEKIMDRVLWDLKQRCGPKIIYITFPADMNLSSINLVKASHNITEIPSVMIDEKIVLSGVTPLEELNNYTGCW